MARRTMRRDPGASAGPSTRARGGTWAPLADDDAARIAEAAIAILCTIGLSDAPPQVIEAIVTKGGRLAGGRLIYGRAFVERALAEMPRQAILCGQNAAHDMDVGGDRTFTGTGGAAPNVVDLDTGRYRPSTLGDLYDAARLADALPHIHFFSRSLVARDMQGALALDLNTAFAALAGTTKHVMVQASEPDHVARIAALCYRIAGSEEAFRARPFLSLNINHVVPPLRFHAESMQVMAEAVCAGIPVHCNIFGQLGASSPVTLAGSVAQTLAETLAGLAFVHALDPSAPRIAGPRPMITDLRTGGMAGGAGEQVMATAICAQVLRRWDLPCSVIAGATDSKLPDAQAGYEKAVTVTTAIQAGANMVTQAAGMQAGLMAVSFPACVIDNEMLGAILRANIAPEVNDDTLALDAISAVVAGEGHFLGRPETHARMKSDFLYPTLADRRSPDDFFASGGRGIEEAGRDRARDILSRHYPRHIGKETWVGLQSEFGLHLDPPPFPAD